MTIVNNTGLHIWVPKNWCFWTVVLEKTLESLLDCKEIKPVHPKGNQPWIFIGRTDAEAPILWPPDAKSKLIGKDPDAGKDRRQETGMTEGDMVGWHQRLNGREFQQTPGDGEGQGSLVCCRPWGHKESDMTELLNNNSWFTMLCLTLTVQQSDSAIHILCHYGLSQDIEYSSPRSTVGPCCLPILYVTVCVC